MGYHVQRTNSSATPPRFEWLRSRPTFDASTETISDLRWTWQDASDPSGWRNGNEPHDFGRRRAERWAAMIDGAIAVRIGDADAVDSAVPTEAERRAEARRRERKALEEGTGEPL